MKEHSKNRALFRLLLQALSRPGELLQWTPPHSYHTELHDTTIDIAICLLDMERSFYYPNLDDAAASELVLRTGGKKAALEDADFIIVPCTSENPKQLLLNAKRGDLIDPHTSATLLIDVDDLSRGSVFLLSGPGIETKRKASLDRLSECLEARNKAVSEFPMGPDILLIDRFGHIMGLPRTTAIQEVSKWDM